MMDRGRLPGNSMLKKGPKYLIWWITLVEIGAVPVCKYVSFKDLEANVLIQKTKTKQNPALQLLAKTEICNT